MNFEGEVRRRRTFAIISHPDAGKTTLTEKLLLYAKAIHLAGSVKAKRASRSTISDWMKIEQERGISATSSVLQFNYDGRALNLLDTPGHADFSEDTFRTLAAVDSAVMLMDHAKGVEPRTLKLFEVCRIRRLPVVTFMNKLDRYGLHPLELVDQVRDKLDLEVSPVNWPLGMGTDFKGVVNLATREIILYEAEGRHESEIVAAERAGFDEAESLVGDEAFDRIYALALYFVHYNFCRIHQSLRVTPAMEAGLTNAPYDAEWIVGLVDAAAPKPAKPGPKPGSKRKR